MIPRRHPLPRSASALAVLVLAVVTACGGEPPVEMGSQQEAGSLVVFSERGEEIVGALLAEWATDTGVEVEVRYLEPGEMAAAIETGPAQQGTVFLSHDAVSLGELAATARAIPLPAELTAGLDPHFVDAERRWVGLTGRARVIVYDPQRLSSEELPGGLAAFGDPAQRGRFGLAPLGHSFRVHLAAYRALHGPEALDRLLSRLAANEPALYPDEQALVEGVLDHDIDFALADHPALRRVRAERGGGAGAVRTLPAADSSGYFDVAGAAVLVESAAALALVRHLLSAPVQARLAATTFEYPLLPTAALADEMVPLAELDLARVDYRAVAAALPATEEAIADSPLLP
ncbi:MAG TPA: hypothetical protein VM617_04965 [Thermoanaerobaculia bacterium]|nr:hypothetical protein [Thermoanaerobaculia bacterium]